MSERSFVSVVVPTRNCERTIAACLDSLMALDFSSFEIIMVDDGSTDGTRQIISRYPVRVVSGPKRGAYAARNSGVECAVGEIVAFTDTDCIVDREWLKNLVKHYSDQRIGGVGGSVQPLSFNTVVGQFLSLGEQEIIHSRVCTNLRDHDVGFMTSSLGSGNMSFRKAVLMELKGFSEDMIKCGDYEMCWRAQRAGYDLIYEPEAKTYHKPSRSLWQLIVQMFEFGLSQPILLRKRLDGYSYFQFRTYLFAPREYRIKLPVQMLVRIDFFSLAILCLVLSLFYPPLIFLLVAFCLAISWHSMKKWKQAIGLKNSKLLLLFPLLHVVRSYSETFGRIVGGLKCGVLSL